MDFSILNTRVRDFSLVTPSRVPGEQGDEEMHAMALATSDGKILVRFLVENSFLIFII